MESTSEMEGSQWVFARNECSVSQAFDRLWKEVQDDVEMRNKISRAGNDSFTYSAVGDTQGKFTVRLNSNTLARSVSFFAGSDHSISAKGENPPVDLKATLALDEDGHCRLKVGGRHLRFWQFRMEALEKLFYF
jgi:hypothetical protein